MRGEKENGRIVVENFLRAVAVVDIPVDDHDALDAVLFLRVARGDGSVSEEAKSFGAFRHGVVPGRAHGGESVAGASGHDRIHGGQRRADRAHGRIVGSPGDRAVGAVAHEFLPLLARGTERRDVVRIMDFRDPWSRIDVLIRSHAG